MAEGRAGICKVRGVRGGELMAMGYGIVSSAGVDPIEKKPLYHFYPGSDIFSIGGWGCNLGCDFCQNWTISQQFVDSRDAYTPELIVKKASSSGSIGIAYTYNEPLIGFEFVHDCAVLAREAGLVNVLVTNGYGRREPAAELIPLIDAMNIDIKSIDEAFYRTHCRASLQPVLDFCVQAVQGGRHVEITNLIIPGLNDSDALHAQLSGWIRENLGQTVPLHLSAYRPEYRLSVAPTPSDTLLHAREIAARDLSYVYLGNVRTRTGQDTLCPGCGHRLIERQGYSTAICGIEAGRCTRCGRKADVVLPRAAGA